MTWKARKRADRAAAAEVSAGVPGEPLPNSAPAVRLVRPHQRAYRYCPSGLNPLKYTASAPTRASGEMMPAGRWAR